MTPTQIWRALRGLFTFAPKRLAAIASSAALIAAVLVVVPVQPASASSAFVQAGPLSGAASGHCWRGYAFKTKRALTVTHITGGGESGDFRGAIYDATGGTGDAPGAISSVRAEVAFTGTTALQSVRLGTSSSPATLQLNANTWYFLAQGLNSATVTGRHHTFSSTSKNTILADHEAALSDWAPGDNQNFGNVGGCIGTASVYSGTPSGETVRPAVGFGYIDSPRVISAVISTPTANRTNSSQYDFLVEWNQNVTGFGSEDVTALLNGVATNAFSINTFTYPAGSAAGSRYTVRLTRNQALNGTLSIRINQAGVSSSSGNIAGSGTFTSSGTDGTRVIDTHPPTITFGAVATPNRANPVTVSVSSTETLTGLEDSDFSAPGCSRSLSGAGATYTLSLSNCTEGPITVSMTGSATDEAGNSAIKPASFSFVADRTFAAGTFATPSTPTNLETLSYSYTPGETLAAGATLAANEISVSGTGCSLASDSIDLESGAFVFDVVGCNDGATAQVSINAGALADPAGNLNPQITSSVQVKRSVLFPAEIITTTTISPTKESQLVFTINFDEPVWGLESTDLSLMGTLSGCQLEDFDEQNNITSFAVTVSGCSHGAEVQLTLGKNAVQDSLGNLGPSTPVQTSIFVVDQVKPTISSFVSNSGAWANAAAPTFTLTMSESVTGITAGMFSTNSDTCTVQTVTGGPIIWTVGLAGCAEGAVSITPELTEEGVRDTALNGFDTSHVNSALSASVTVDLTAPTASWETVPAGPINTQPVFAINFSEQIDALTFVGTDVTNAGSAGCQFMVTQSEPVSRFLVTAIGCGDGTVQPSLAAGAIADRAGNPLASTAVAASAITVDFTKPTVLFTEVPSVRTNVDVLEYQVTFSEPVLTPSPAAFANLGNADDCAIEISADPDQNQDPSTTVFSLAVSSCTEGIVVLTILEDTVSDLAGNLGPAAALAAAAITIDRTAPIATVSSPLGVLTNAAVVVFDIAFNEEVSGLTNSESTFDLTGGCTLGALTGTQPGTQFSIQVTGCPDSSNPSLAVVANSITEIGRAHV
jgi:hypothetical protein